MTKCMKFALTLAAALALANLSFGHAKLVASSPASGARLSESPHVLTLTFDEEVKLGKLTLTRDETPITVNIDTAASGAKTVTVPVVPLTPGVYELHWTALATDDGHVTKGTFTFTVLAAATAHFAFVDLIHSIKVEVLLAALILGITATMTTLVGPRT